MRWHARHAWLGGLDLTEDVVIEVHEGTIAHVGVGRSDTDGARRLDGVVLPGLVSAHSHAFHRALRGRTSEPGGDFWSWREVMYKLANELTPALYRALAEAVFAEMLEAGITTVGEFHYLHHDEGGRSYDDPNAMGKALIDAAIQVGIRLTLIDTLYLASDASGSLPLPEQTRFSDRTVGSWSERVRDLSRFLEGNDLVRLGVAAHSVRGVAVADLGAVATVAEELDIPLHIHVSEQIAENEDCLEAHGVTPVQLLGREGFLGPRTTLVHATHLSADDIRTIGESGAGVCLCPTTEADLGDGIGPAAELSSAGVKLSVGSDSNAIIDMLEESRGVEHHDRLRLGRRDIHGPDDLLAMATRNGADALGWSGAGVIARGAPADFVVLDPDSLDLSGMDLSTISGLAMSASRAAVTDVVVGGEHVVAAGHLVSGPSRAERATVFASLYS